MHLKFKAALALAHPGLGRLDEALDAVTSDGQGKEGQTWFVPELLRIKGELLLQQAADQSVHAIEDCYDEVGEMVCD